MQFFYYILFFYYTYFRIGRKLLKETNCCCIEPKNVLWIVNNMWSTFCLIVSIEQQKVLTWDKYREWFMNMKRQKSKQLSDVTKVTFHLRALHLAPRPRVCVTAAKGIGLPTLTSLHAAFVRCTTKRKSFRRQTITHGRKRLSRQSDFSRVGKRRASKERAIFAVTPGYWLLINYERRHQDSSSAEKTAFNSSTLHE